MRLEEAFQALRSDSENPIRFESKLPSQDLLALHIGDLTTDSRRVQKGGCFIAIQGGQNDGHQFLKAVCEKEPALLVVQSRLDVPTQFSGVVLEVQNTRRAWAVLAAQEFNQPTKEFLTLGITGTNGKTSCTYIFEHLLNRLGLACGVIGTIDHHLNSKVWKTSATTPGPLELQSRLREMKIQGAEAVAMEVSSHALHQHRVDQVHFDLALFTNLTRDHLDYHLRMEDYFSAKQRLFTDLLWESQKPQPLAVVNLDDPWGRKLRVAQKARLVTYGTAADADWVYQIDQRDFAQIEFRLRYASEEVKVSLPMVGDHQVANAVGVMASIFSLHERMGARRLSLRNLVSYLEDFEGVPGRLERVKNSKAVHVFVDYAHSPDALENVLQSLIKIRTQANLKSRIITVFGCGGERDQGKRPIMGEIAQRLSDAAIVTSDNPRSEDPEKILQEIAEGMKMGDGKLKPILIADRRAAIQKALESASPGDVVLIAGKGHEDYQEIAGHKYTFRDQAVVKELLP